MAEKRGIKAELDVQRGGGSKHEAKSCWVTNQNGAEYAVCVCE